VLPFRGSFTVWRNWDNRNVRKYNKVKCKILHLGRNNPMHQYMMWTA